MGKQKMKKILSMFLAVLMVTCMLPMTALAHSGNKTVHEHSSLLGKIQVKISAGTGGLIYSPDSQDQSDKGETWWFQAIPDDGYSFTGWQVTDGPSGAFTPSGDKLNVTFTEEGYYEWFTLHPVHYNAAANFTFTGYTVTFDLGGHGTRTGGGALTQTVTNGKAVEPTVQGDEANGYRFAGWDVNLNGINKSMTVHAKYQYRVTFNAGEHGSITSGDAQPWVTAGGNAAAPGVTANSGWRFTQWENSYKNVNGPITVNAQYIQLFTVAVNAEGNGHLDNPNAFARSYDAGTTIDLMDAGPEDNENAWQDLWENHYYFAGWRDNSTNQLLSENAWGEVNVTVDSNKSYTAVFRGSSEDLTAFVRADSTAYGRLTNNIDGHYDFGSQVNLTALAQPAATQEGYEFKYWEEEVGGTWKPIEIGQHDKNIITVGVVNDYRAVFGIKTFTVTFVDADGNTIGTPQTVNWGQPAAAPATNPQKPGHTFKCWDTDFSSVKGNLTVGPTYDINTYQVVFNAGDHGVLSGGRTRAVQDVQYLGDAVPPEVTSNEGWRFTGWDGSYNDVTGNVEVTAQYTQLNHVTFDLGGHGSIISGEGSQWVLPGETATAPSAAGNEADGYRFDHWNLDGIDLSNITADTTVHAVYQYRITFNAGSNGSITAGDALQWVTAGGNAAEPTVQANSEAWHFDGWSGSLTNIAGPADLTAQYFQRYHVVFDLGGHGSITSGSGSQWVASGAGATAPVVLGDEANGYRFGHWDINLSNITADTTVHAVYQYRITFNAGSNGSITAGDALQWVTAGGNAAEPTVQANSEAWHFDGWSGSLTNVAGPADLTAQYSQRYRVVFDLGGHGSITSGSGSQWVASGEGATAPIVMGDETNGYRFDHWDVNPSNITADTTVHAVYRYKVLFMGGLYGDITQKGLQWVLDGENAEEPVLAVMDIAHKFAEWDGDFARVTTPLTVTAQYTIKQFNVIFSAGNGSFAADNTVPTTQTVDYNTAATAPKVTPPTGYDFTTWSTSFDHVTSALTVTAQYTIKQFNVIFSAGNGSFAADNTVPTTQTVDYNNAATAPKVTPPTGYDFTTWSTSFDHVTSALTVTAQYTIKQFNVIFSAGNGSFAADNTVPTTQTVNYNTAAQEPKVTPPTGYDFTTWSTSFDHVTSALTVTAQYTIKQFNVIFSAGNGSFAADNTVPVTQTIDYNTAAQEPKVTPPTHYHFTGWDTKFDHVTSALTVTAQYAVDTFKVTFSAGTGTFAADNEVLTTQTVDYSTAATAPKVTPPTGYHFTTWDTSFDHVTSALTVTAQYAIDTYTLSVAASNFGSVQGLSGQYNYGTVIDLTNVTATPAAGYQFAGFTDQNGNAITTLTLTQNSIVTPVFNAIPVTIAPDNTPAAAAPARTAGGTVTVTSSAAASSSAVSSAAPSSVSSQSSSAVQSQASGTQTISDDQTPKAQAGNGSAQNAGGFSPYWFIPIFGIPLFLFFFLIWRRKKSEDDEAK